LLQFGRSISRDDAIPSGQRLFVITFMAGFLLAAATIIALMELRGRMLVAFNAVGVIIELQATRAGTLNALIDARDNTVSFPGARAAAPGRDVMGKLEGMSALGAELGDDPEIQSLVADYVLAANAAITDLNAAPAAARPPDPANMRTAFRDVAKARDLSDALHAVLNRRAGEHRAALHRDIEAIILAVGALIAGVALIALAQGWEFLAMARRLFTEQTDHAARIATLSSTLTESREALDAVNRRLTLALRSAHVVVFSLSRAGQVTWSHDAGNGIFGGSAPPFPLSGLAPAEDRDRLDARLARASPSEAAVEFEMRVETEGLEQRWVRITLVPSRAEGEGDFLGSAMDITDIKRREEGNFLLTRELSHRSKNLLAVVQVIARKTAQAAASPVEFYERFGARLRALAAGHDLLVTTLYTSVGLGDLIRSQIGGLESLIGSRIFAQGPAVRLRPEAAQNLGMALHELANNAEIHGALTAQRGRVDIVWSLEGGGSEGRLILDWVESNGPPTPPPERRGFGSTLILENLPRALHGVVTLDHLPEGTRCHMDLPFKYTLERFELGEAGAEPVHHAGA
jgi:two-component sensor histidine kinase